MALRRISKMGRVIVVVLGALVLGAQSASASMMLKPKGAQSQPLRLKRIQANVEIERQFALTKTVMTFQNEVSDRIEADFIYTLPQGSVATYFAYWYGEEKVVARVVEKGRAASIYQHITSRMRDPALIEMIGKNTFRARIFPIMPDADLRIEMHTVETLASTAVGARYTFPLAPQSKGTGTLDALDVTVRIKRDGDLIGAGNDWALPVEARNGQWTMRLSQRNFRPTRDLHIGLGFRAQALRARLLAAPSGGRDGFFALALTPTKNIRNARLSISGVRAYDVLPRRLGNLKAGRQVTVVGRYRNAGKSAGAKIRLGALQSAVVFGSVRRPNNAATGLWAARQMEALGADKRNQTRVVALSERFNMPSKWTSWLAIPTEERKRYKNEKARADVAYYARLLVRERAAGRGRSAKARRLRRQFHKSANDLEMGSEESKAIYDDQKVAYKMELADAFVEAKHRGNAKSLAAIRRRLRAAVPTARHRNVFVAGSEQRRSEGLISDKNRLIADEILSGRLDEPRIAALEQERDVLKKRHGISYSRSDGDLYGALHSQANVVAYKIEKEKQAARPDEKKLAAWQGELSELKKKSGNALDMSRHLDWARRWISSSNAPFDEAAARQMYLSQSWGQGGDPLILVEAPADALQVVAILPDGSVKQLVFDAQSKRWEARFDVPTYALEGVFEITVVIVAKDGTRRLMKLHYNVDVTAPRGEALAQRAKVAGKWHLQVQGDNDTARVAALLPSGAKVELKPSAQDSRRFVAIVDAPQSDGATPVVTYILTDRAHNRTQITVDLSQ